MATCIEGYLALAMNPSTLKVQYNETNQKAILVPGGCTYQLHSAGKCCPQGESGNWEDLEYIRFYMKGIRGCSGGEIIEELDGKIVCVKHESGYCQWSCELGDYKCYVYSYLTDYCIVRITKDGQQYDVFYGTTSCGALPLKISNDFESGDCGGVVIGYGGTVLLGSP